MRAETTLFYSSILINIWRKDDENKKHLASTTIIIVANKIHQWKVKSVWETRYLHSLKWSLHKRKTVTLCGGPDDTTLIKSWKLPLPVMRRWHHVPPDVIHWKDTSMIFLPKTHNPILNMSKHQTPERPSTK